MTVLLLILIAIIAYCLGNISGSMLLTRLLFKKNRNKYCAVECSLSEFYKDFGPIGLAFLLIFELLKTALAVMMGGWLLGIVDQTTVGRLFGTFALLMGQSYPLLFFFRGGKGLLNAGIAAFLVDWRVGLCCWVVYVVVIIFTRYASLGALVAAVAAPILMWVFDFTGLPCTLALLCALLLVLSHGENLLRLVGGTEPRCFEYGKKPARAADELAEEDMAEDIFDDNY